MSGFSSHAMSQYKRVGTRVGADSANPHQLIVMLFDGALEKIAIAKGAIVRNEVADKGHAIGRAIAIIDGLRASLDKEKGGEVAENLDELYEYLQRRLLDANLNSDQATLNEVADLLREIKAAWDAIPLDNRMVVNG